MQARLWVRQAVLQQRVLWEEQEAIMTTGRLAMHWECSSWFS
jgi:hypothetical protein